MPVNSKAPRRTGTVFYFSGNTAPAWAVEASGQSLSRTTEAALWAYAQASGNLAASEGAKKKGQYGPGDGATTFTVPNLQGEFIRSLDKAGTVDSGRTIGSEQAGQMPSHTHGVPASGGAGATVQIAGSSGQAPGSLGTSAAGGTENGSENRPRNVALLACIER